MLYMITDLRNTPYNPPDKKHPGVHLEGRQHPVGSHKAHHTVDNLQHRDEEKNVNI